ncbi:unnamed protein product [Toxocara canis]|nr:unnamed protein product [Toxocara canis]
MEKLDRMEREENERNELEETSSDDESALDSDDLPEWDVDSSGGPRVRASASGVAIEKDKATKETAVAAMEDDHGPCCSSEPLMDSVSPPLRIDAIAERTACEGRRARRSQRSVRFRSEVECTPSVDEVRGDSVADEGLKAGANENAKNAPTQEEVPEDEPKTIINDEPRFSTALPRRSILRNSAERSPIDAKAVAEADCRDRPLIAPSSEQVFTGVICERLNPEVPSSSTSTHVGPGASAAQQRNSQSSAEPSKRVSRFKMYRAQLDRPNR